MNQVVSGFFDMIPSNEVSDPFLSGNVQRVGVRGASTRS